MPDPRTQIDPAALVREAMGSLRKASSSPMPPTSSQETPTAPADVVQEHVPAPRPERSRIVSARTSRPGSITPSAGTAPWTSCARTTGWSLATTRKILSFTDHRPDPSRRHRHQRALQDRAWQLLERLQPQSARGHPAQVPARLLLQGHRPHHRASPWATWASSLHVGLKKLRALPDRRTFRTRLLHEHQPTIPT